jgi:plasmid stabilization system protein ParE
MDDLRDIRSYIAQHDPAAASRVAVQLVAACDQLESLSHRGRRGLVAGTRELASVRPYVIVYRVTSAAVEIMRVWHGAQLRT